MLIEKIVLSGLARGPRCKPDRLTLILYVY